MKLFLSYFGPAILAACAAAAMTCGARAEDAGSCYAVGDADARQYCLAKARKDPGTCYAVQRADMRAQCLAEVRR